MGTLRRINKTILNKELLKGYDAIVFSVREGVLNKIVNSKFISNIIDINKIKNIIKELDYGDIKIFNNNGKYIVWNITYYDTISRFIDILKVVDLSNLNGFKDVLFCINDEYEVKLYYKLFKYITDNNSINIDLIGIEDKFIDKNYSKLKIIH